MLKRGVLVVAAAAACVLSTAAAQPAPKKITFLTNYVFLGRHSPFFVGIDEGFYREAGFDLTVSPATGSAFVISALEGGQADYGIAETAPIVQAIGKGARVKVKGEVKDVVDIGSIFKLPDEIGSGLVLLESSHRAN